MIFIPETSNNNNNIPSFFVLRFRVIFFLFSGRFFFVAIF